jgi:hypothetical protein
MSISSIQFDNPVTFCYNVVMAPPRETVTSARFGDMGSEPLKRMLTQFLVVVVFSIAFAYIEAAVVVYLRTIFHPEGFSFPLTNFGVAPVWQQLLLTELRREAATMVLILTAAWLVGQNLRTRFAYVLVIFAIWDVFYYVWLKVLIDWPASILDWDILFLIPTTWASAVLAPVLVSLTMFIFAVIILYRACCGKMVKVTAVDWLGFIVAGLVLVFCFCIAGLHITEPNYRSHFHWPLFAFGHILAVAVFVKCLLKSR